MEVANDRLYVLQDSVLYYRADNQWVAAGRSLRWISATDNRLFGYMEGRGVVVIGAEEVRNLGDYNVVDMQYDVANNCYWMAASGTGIIRLNGQNEVQTFRPNGPISNYGYRLRYTDGHIYVAGGSRWATEAVRPGDFSVYDGETWHGISATETLETLRSKGIWSLPMAPRDIVSIGGDPRDGGHFFAAMYGMGLLEFRDYQVVGHYNKDNSTLYPAAENNPAYYTRVEAPMVDEEGNLWVLNTGANAHPINIMTPQGQWYGLDIRPSGGSALHLETPWEITVDNRNTNYKWLIDQRSSTGVILLDDGGTPIDGSDDRSMKRNTFLDTDNIQLRPENIFCLAQDLDGDIWIGTPSGIIVIPSSVDFFTSNACMRIKIPRNDGTNLADYLLGTERINAIVVDGANRKWIGTETSGIYLMSADGLTTLAHFTTENSVLPSNTILSIAIHPQTGEVFVGTGSGIASYRSDAAEAHDDLEEVYAFPNPVRPHYQGVITITGLMENTTVNIIDAGGNLVCKTRSNGGIAVWDGKNFRGERVGSGVYTALCNAEGKNHTAVKILVMN